ncbi:hypothetical protein VDG1235_3389 [Verrucomicrobiia bacterium DG1235]|nr:hypothetical protein VDG1235_3389 [Verrucomicrobiae bacterium DG1235]
MVHDGKDDWRSEGRDLLSKANQLVSEERNYDNKATHTTSANARPFHNEPLGSNDLRHGSQA